MIDYCKLHFCLLIATLIANAFPARAADNTFKGNTGNVFMEETFSTPQIEQDATKSLYGAYASVFHHHYDAADRWIAYGRYKAPGEVFQAREDSGYLLSVLNKEATKQRHAQVKDTSFEFQVLNALIKQNLGESEIALQSFKDVAVKYPNHSSIEFLKIRIRVLEYELLMNPWDTPPDVVRIGGKKNYLHKWRMNKFPLKVFIPAESECLKVKGYRVGDNRLLSSSFDIWQKENGDKVKFVVVSDKTKADIVCNWVSERKDLTISDAVGVCIRYTDTSNLIRKAEIKILTFSDVLYRQDSKYRNQTLAECCMHEIGHSLGLNHSSGENDVMTFHVHAKPLAKPTQRDLSSLNTLYLTNLNDMLNEVIELIETRNLVQAEVVLDKMIAKQSTDDQTRESICICLTKIANLQIKSNEYRSAIKKMLKAKALLNGKESKKVRESVLKTLTLAYLKAGEQKEAGLLEKQIEDLTKADEEQLQLLDKIGTNKEAIAAYEKALASDPKNERLILKFKLLLLNLAKEELLKKNEVSAFAHINRIEELTYTGYGHTTEKEYSEVQNFIESFPSIISMARLVCAAKKAHPDQWKNIEAEKAQIEKIKVIREQYEQALRQCAVLYKLKNEYNWASIFIVRSKKYDVPGSKEPFATLYSLRHKLIELTDENAVILTETGLPPN